MNEETRRKLVEGGRKGGRAKVLKGIHTYPPEIRKQKLREAGRRGAAVTNSRLEVTR